MGYGWTGAWGGLHLAHRVSWHIFNGPIPDGMKVCHKCDNPPCVNPAHLFLGTHIENMEDMSRKGRRARMPGEKNPRAKLTEADVRHIRGSTLSTEELTARFGVSKSTIHAARSGTTWRHLT
jgi:hypothetical protein